MSDKKLVQWFPNLRPDMKKAPFLVYFTNFRLMGWLPGWIPLHIIYVWRMSWGAAWSQHCAAKMTLIPSTCFRRSLLSKFLIAPLKAPYLKNIIRFYRPRLVWNLQTQMVYRILDTSKKVNLLDTFKLQPYVHCVTTKGPVCKHWNGSPNVVSY